MKIGSKINTNMIVSDDNWVVSLVRKSQHAVIVVESIGFEENEKGLCMRWFDFLVSPDERNKKVLSGKHLATIFAAVNNKPLVGEVRYCPNKKNDGEPLYDLSESTTKQSLFDGMGWNMDTDSWPCRPDLVRRMVENIKADISNQKNNTFTLSGHYPGLNCTTWAWKKLKIAGIDARNYNFANIIAVSASNNIGEARNKLCNII